MSKRCKQEIKLEQVEIPAKSSGFLCPMCGDHFFSEDHFLVHIREHKSVSNCPIKREIKSELENTPVFICPICTEHVHTDTQLMEHVKHHHDYRSPEVTEILDTTDNLTVTDLQKTLVQSPRNSLSVKPFRCSECSFAARRASDLTKHKRIHSDEKPFKCSKCSYAAKQASHLTNHISVHNNR